MSWHFQLMKHEVEFGDFKEHYYSIHEFFEFDDGKTGWTDICQVDGESLEDVEWVLKKMLEDVQSRGIRDYKTGEKLE
jgi:hypothetical protein